MLPSVIGGPVACFELEGIENAPLEPERLQASFCG